MNKKTGNTPRNGSSSECKPLTETVVAISLRAAFENPMQEVRHAFETCDDGCPNQHYTKAVAGFTVDLRGHPSVSNDGGCYSTLRVLRAAGTHYPVLGNFCHYVNNAISSHLCVRDIDMAMLSGDCESLMEIKVDYFDVLLSNSVESRYEQCTVLSLQTRCLGVFISNQSFW